MTIYIYIWRRYLSNPAPAGPKSIYFYISLRIQNPVPVGLPIHIVWLSTARKHGTRRSSARAMTLLDFRSNQEPRDTQTGSTGSNTFWSNPLNQLSEFRKFKFSFMKVSNIFIFMAALPLRIRDSWLLLKSRKVIVWALEGRAQCFQAVLQS